MRLNDVHSIKLCVLPPFAKNLDHMIFLGSDYFTH